MRRQTHFGLSADQITWIDYDYDGPQGCQRKIVYTTVGTFLYYQIGNAWVPQGLVAVRKEVA